MSVLCFHLSAVFSFYLSQGEGDGSTIRAYLAVSLSTLGSSFVSQGEKGLIWTYVCTWLSLCHVLLLIAW